MTNVEIDNAVRQLRRRGMRPGLSADHCAAIYCLAKADHPTVPEDVWQAAIQIITGGEGRTWRYFVSYMTHNRVGVGNVELIRPRPITSIDDVHEIERDVAKMYPDRGSVTVLHYLLFEDDQP